MIDRELGTDLILDVAFVLRENRKPITAEAVTVHLLRALYISSADWDELHARALEIYNRAVEVIGD